MLLTISTNHEPATDLGYLLHKHPDRCQSFDLSFGKAHVFYPEASAERCVACLLLDVDPVGLVRGKGNWKSGPLDQYVNDRPYVASSLMSVAISQVYDLAVWSSATSDYVGEIASNIRTTGNDWKFVWARDRCIPRMHGETCETVYIKDLKKVKRLGYSLDRILFVDDTPNKMARNYGNAIYVQPFEGADDDSELPRLLIYLQKIRNEQNYRTLEKRGWRSWSEKSP